MTLDFLARPPASYWVDSVPIEPFPKLTHALDVDVAVVGAGITGLTTARLLSKDGLRVAVLEARRVLRGTTGHTTAKVTAQHTLTYHHLNEAFGQALATQYAKANEYAIQAIAGLVRDMKIDCDFKWQPAYAYTEDESQVKCIQQEVDAARLCGLSASFLTSTPLPFPVRAAVRFDNQAQFHPLKFMKALLDDIVAAGVEVYEGTRVTGMETADGKVVLETDRNQRVVARDVVLCTQYPCFDGRKLYFTKLYPSRSGIVMARTDTPLPEGMYINVESPGRSLRSVDTPEGPMALFIGDGYKTGQSDNTCQNFRNLLEFGQRHYQVRDVAGYWASQDYTTPDEVPYIGRLAPDCEHVYFATGFKKWGMTTGTFAARIIRDAIVHEENPWCAIFDPERESHRAGTKTFMKENLNVARKLVSGKLRRVEKDLDLANDEGQAVEFRGRKAGAYRDEMGRLHVVDNTCTHLGCELNWNPAERTWDCPCHGSRFNYDGEVIEGPAQKNLERLEV